MPETKTSINALLNEYESEFGDKFFRTDGQTALCKLCETKVSVWKRFIVLQRSKTPKHKDAENIRSIKNIKNALF